MTPAKPLELIEARSLISRLTTASFLVDSEGTLLYFNEPAAELLGIGFEEAGAMEAGTWGSRFEPRAPDGRELPGNELPLTIALDDGRPHFARMCITAADGRTHDIEVTALPVVAGSVQHGALAIFWPFAKEEDESRAL
jgi:PAS domain-containing protein